MMLRVPHLKTDLTSNQKIIKLVAQGALAAEHQMTSDPVNKTETSWSFDQSGTWKLHFPERKEMTPQDKNAVINLTTKLWQEGFINLTTQPIRCILLGGPGAGKGTMSQKILRNYNVVHVSTGDLLRAEVKDETDIGVAVKSIMESGALVPDDVAIDIVKRELNRMDESQGWILDGFPRTLNQAKALDAFLSEKNCSLSSVFNLHVSDASILDRLGGRWTHIPSGRSYHERNCLPKKHKWIGDTFCGWDDITGDLLVQRKDDNSESIKERLETYHKISGDILEFYRKGKSLFSIDAENTMPAWRLIQLALGPSNRTEL